MREPVLEAFAADDRLRVAVTPRPPNIEVPEPARVKTLERLNKAASRGISHAQCNLAGKYLRGEDVPEDLSKAQKWLTKAAEQGYTPAQTLLGVTRFTGVGLPRDLAETAFWWSLASHQGNVGAKVGTELIQSLLKPNELVKSERLKARWGSLITDLSGLAAGPTNLSELNRELQDASQRGDVSAVLSLLARGADADSAGEEGRDAVINAAWRGRNRIV
jgi:TPR repeat protein